MKKLIRRLAGPLAVWLVARLATVAVEERVRRAQLSSDRTAERIASATKAGKLLPRLPRNIFQK